MDITSTIEPDSSQVNADDLIGSAKIVTVTGVTKGTAEQPVFIELAEFPGRTYRPSKTMRRVLVAAWGSEASAYIGRRIQLYRDPEVTFGKDKVGGIRISALSDIDKPLDLALTVTRGRRSSFKVAVLPKETAPAEISDDDATAFDFLISEAATVQELDRIAADLKALNLGKHRKALHDAWRKREYAINAPDEAVE